MDNEQPNTQNYWQRNKEAIISALIIFLLATGYLGSLGFSLSIPDFFYLKIPALYYVARFVFWPIGVLPLNLLAVFGLGGIYVYWILSLLWVYLVCRLSVWLFSKLTNKKFVVLGCFFVILLSISFWLSWSGNKSCQDRLRNNNDYGYLENSGLVFIYFGSMGEGSEYIEQWDGAKVVGTPFPEAKLKFLSWLYGFDAIIPTYLNSQAKIYHIDQVYAKVKSGSELSVRCYINKVFNGGAETAREPLLFEPTYDGKPEFWSNVDKNFCQKNIFKTHTQDDCEKYLSAGKGPLIPPPIIPTITVLDCTTRQCISPGPKISEAPNEGFYSNSQISLSYSKELYEPQVVLYHLPDQEQTVVTLDSRSAPVGNTRIIKVTVTNYTQTKNMSNNAWDAYNYIQRGEETSMPTWKNLIKVKIGDYEFIRYVYDVPTSYHFYAPGHESRLQYSVTLNGHIQLDIDAENNNDSNYILEVEKIIKTIKVKSQ